jgi:glucose-6-phosphate-specific signal transduction histidine kinase
MSALGAYVDSWYMFWGFPYALGRRRVLANLLLWFPLVAALLDLTLVQTWTLPLVASVIVAYLLSNRPGRDAARVGAP